MALPWVKLWLLDMQRLCWLFSPVVLQAGVGSLRGVFLQLVNGKLNVWVDFFALFGYQGTTRCHLLLSGLHVKSWCFSYRLNCVKLCGILPSVSADLFRLEIVSLLKEQTAWLNPSRLDLWDTFIAQATTTMPSEQFWVLSTDAFGRAS